jgi:glutaredoxin
MMKKITLATSQTCGPCHLLKNKINLQNLEVEIKDFSDPENIEWFRKHQIRAVPRLVIEDENGDTVDVIQGTEDILEAIKSHKN